MNKPEASSKRKKIWEIDHGYLCATIGSCLSRSEMRQLVREPEFRDVSLRDDHGLHALFIDVAKSCDPMSKALQRFFDKKYRQATRYYFLTEDSKAIAQLWQDDLSLGKIDTAWFAVVTHPAVTMEQASSYYAQLHMLAHDGIANFYRNRLVEARESARLSELEGQLATLKHLRKTDKKSLREMEQQGKTLQTLSKRLQRENEQLRHDVAEQRKAPPVSQHPVDDQASINLASELTAVRLQLKETTQRFQELQEQHLALMQHHEDQHKELQAFENLLQRRLAMADPCLACDDQATANCPGRNLCGQTVLYVGGLHKMIPHYKQLVETLGGRFLHHDGGKEESRNLLPKMLATADAVLCPIDCVSHDACLSVKKICKRYQKPFVMMRSASLSALAKGLTDFVQ